MESKMNKQKIKNKFTQKVNEEPIKQGKKSNTFIWMSLIAIVVLGFIIYSNSFDCSFHLDDKNNIMENVVIRDISNVDAMWKYSQNRFVPFYSFAINYHFSELDVKSYHYFNLLVHLINACLVWWLTLLIFSLPNLANSKFVAHKKGIAFIIALLFVSHPLATQSVTYIVQRMASMAALFYFLSVILYIKGRISESNGKFLYFIGSFIAAILALLSKENAYTLPIAIILCEVFFLQTKKIKVNLLDKRMLLLVAVLILISFKFSFSIFSPKIPGGGNDYMVTSSNYLLTQFKVIPEYIQLLLFPIQLNLDHDIDPSFSLFEGGTFIGFLFLLSLLAFGVYVFNKNKLLSFGIFWFFITLSIESSIIPIEDVMFEHRTYLPSFGFFIALVPILFHFLYSKSNYLAYFLFIIIIGSNSILTYQRNKVWKNELSLWNDVVSKSPNKARPYLNRGVANWELENWSEAMSDYNQAVKLNPKYFASAYCNLGVAQSKFNLWDKSIYNFTKAIKINPSYFEAFEGRGIAYGNLNQIEKAIADFNAAIQFQPNNALYYYNRGNIYLGKKQWKEANNDFTKAIELNPNYIDAYSNRSIVYVNLKELDNAIADCSKTIELNPDYNMAYKNRAMMYTELKNYEKALADYSKLIQLNPNIPDGYLNRGILYNNLKQYDKAYNDFDIVLKMQPNNKYAQDWKAYTARFLNK